MENFNWVQNEVFLIFFVSAQTLTSLLSFRILHINVIKNNIVPTTDTPT